jgi:hypothetical protein
MKHFMTWGMCQVPGGVKSNSANCTCQILNLAIKTKTTFSGEQKLYKEHIYIYIYIGIYSYSTGKLQVAMSSTGVSRPEFCQPAECDTSDGISTCPSNPLKS